MNGKILIIDNKLNVAKNKKCIEGITLITLVITIVLLIILAGITINIAIGDNGLFKKAKEAKVNFQTASNEEISMLSNIDIDKYVNTDGENKGNNIQISEKNYGDKVKYDVQVNGQILDNWKIFYKDINTNDIFIIYGDYLPYQCFPTICNFEDTSTSKPDQVLWTLAPNIQSKWSINASLFKASNYTLNENYTNSKCVSVLLNTENWVSIVNNKYADLAIGSPSIEMWCASWNAKGYTNANISLGEKGYKINDDDGGIYETIQDELFWPTNFNEEKGYWIASPADYKEYGLYSVNKSGMGGSNHGNSYAYYCLRPVVHLKSTTKLKWNDTNTLWELE